MANKTETLMNNEILRQRLGTNARVRVAKRFKSEIVWKHLETIYRNKNF